MEKRCRLAVNDCKPASNLHFPPSKISNKIMPIKGEIITLGGENSKTKFQGVSSS
jgi:hypothetical protein